MSGNRPDEADSARPQSEADAAAARIAELVRRSSERRQQPVPSSAEGDEAPQGEATPSSGAPYDDGPTPGSSPVPPGGGGATPVPADAQLPAAERSAETATERTAELPAVPGHPAYPDSSAVPPQPDSGRGGSGGRPTGQRPVPGLLRDRRVVAALAAAAAVMVAVMVWLVAAGPGEPPAAKPKPSATASVPGGYTVKASDTVTDCRANSRGKVQQAFSETPCRHAERYLATGVVDGRPVLYVVSRTTLRSASDAAAIRVVIDGTGTGNINDLLRDGVTYPGAPTKMPRSGYASLQDGAVLVVAEAGFTDGGASSNTDPRLRAAAAAAAKHVVDLPS